MSTAQAKQNLLTLQAKLEERLAAITKDLRKEHSKDWEEQAQERENDEVLEALPFELSDELTQIQKALLKIENGNYGICSDCGNDIGDARLEAVPDANLCIKCASAA